jgi:hypothetical protein
MKKVIDLVSQLSLKFYSQHVISTVSPAQEGEIEINTQSKNRFYGKSLMEEELCLVDNCTTNSIFRKTKYFQTLIQRFGNDLIIPGHDTMIVGSMRATVTPCVTILLIIS